MDVAVRTDGDASALAPVLRREILALDRNVPVAKLRTMDDVLAASVADRRFNLLLLGSFAAIALLLAVAGIYGVMSTSSCSAPARLAYGSRSARRRCTSCDW